MAKGVDFLLRKNKVTVFKGYGTVSSPEQDRGTGQRSIERGKGEEHHHRDRFGSEVAAGLQLR